MFLFDNGIQVTRYRAAQNSNSGYIVGHFEIIRQTRTVHATSRTRREKALDKPITIGRRTCWLIYLVAP